MGISISLYSRFHIPFSAASGALPNGSLSDPLCEIGMLPASVVVEPHLDICLWRFGTLDSELELSLSMSWSFLLSFSQGKDERKLIRKARESSCGGLHIELFNLSFSILVYTKSFKSKIK